MGASAPVGLFVNWLNTAFILLLITVAVAAVVGSLARQLLGSIFDLDPDTERGDSVTSDPQRPSPHALRGFSRAARDSHRRRNAGT